MNIEQVIAQRDELLTLLEELRGFALLAALRAIDPSSIPDHEWLSNFNEDGEWPEFDELMTKARDAIARIKRGD